MNKYETVFILKPDSTEEIVQSSVDRLSERIDKAGGKLALVDHWGNRKLAYPVQYRGEKLFRGYYIMLGYLAFYLNGRRIKSLFI